MKYDTPIDLVRREEHGFTVGRVYYLEGETQLRVTGGIGIQGLKDAVVKNPFKEPESEVDLRVRLLSAADRRISIIIESGGVVSLSGKINTYASEMPSGLREWFDENTFFTGSVRDAQAEVHVRIPGYFENQIVTLLPPNFKDTLRYRYTEVGRKVDLRFTTEVPPVRLGLPEALMNGLTRMTDRVAQKLSVSNPHMNTRDIVRQILFDHANP
jgi:hypothetical protein